MTSLVNLVSFAGDPVISLPLAEDTVIATLGNQTQGSTITLDNTFNGMFKVVGNLIKAGPACTRPGLYGLSGTEVLAGAFRSPAQWGLTVKANATLAALTLTALAMPVSGPAGEVVARIIGKTPGTGLVLSPDDGRLVITGDDGIGWTIRRGVYPATTGTFDFSVAESGGGVLPLYRKTNFTMTVGAPFIAATRGDMPWTQDGATSGALTADGRMLYRMGDTIPPYLRIGIAPWYVNASTPGLEVPLPNPVPLAGFGLEINGVTTPVTWSGSVSALLPGGPTVYSDPIPTAGLGLTPYGQFWGRLSCVAPLTTTKWNSGMGVGSQSNPTLAGVPGQFMARHNPASPQYAGVGPMTLTGGGLRRVPMAFAICGLGGARRKSVAFLGDSIADGSNASYDQVEGGRGFADLSCMWDGSRAIPYIRLTRGGDSAAAFVASGEYRTAAFSIVSDVIVAYGANDIGRDGASVSAFLSNLQDIAARARAAGARVHICTLPPRTTGNWTTLAGQVANATYVTKRAQIKAALQAAVGTWFDTLLELGEVFNDVTEPDKWPANSTMDGIHPDGVDTVTGASPLHVAAAAYLKPRIAAFANP